MSDSVLYTLTKYLQCTLNTDFFKIFSDDLSGSVSYLSGQLPDPVQSQAHLKGLMAMMDDEKLRQALLNSLQLQSSCQDIMKYKVRNTRS